MFSKTRGRHKAGKSMGGHGRKLIGSGLILGSAIWGAGKLGWSITTINWPALIWPVAIAIIGALILFGSGRKAQAIRSMHS